METPVLTQSQRSKALSGNKSKHKKKSTKIRNVLANFTSSSSIKLSEQDSITFEEKLSEVFHHTVPKKPKWDEVKQIPKEKRAEFRSTLQKQKNPLMCNLIFGINAVTRAIENQTCKLVLLANDINPAILTRHIHEGCSTHQLPLFEIVDLRHISRKCFGFPTIAMAFKTIPDDLLMIKEFFVSIAPEILQNINNNNNKNNSNVKSSKVVIPKQKQILEEKKIESSIKTKEVYLFRENVKTRCFVPPTRTSGLKSNENKHPMDFIAFESDNESNEKNKQSYVKLKVKRIRPNPNRLKGKKKI